VCPFLSDFSTISVTICYIYILADATYSGDKLLLANSFDDICKQSCKSVTEKKAYPTTNLNISILSNTYSICTSSVSGKDDDMLWTEYWYRI
jgi:hypothetical protein